MKKCRFKVDYGSEVARFTDYSDALTFARLAGYAEVSDKTGLVAQFVEGKLTPEFEHVAKEFPGIVTAWLPSQIKSIA